MDALNKYMRYRRLPKDLAAKCVAFYEYQWLQVCNTVNPKSMSERGRIKTHHIAQTLW